MSDRLILAMGFRPYGEEGNGNGAEPSRGMHDTQHRPRTHKSGTARQILHWLTYLAAAGAGAGAGAGGGDTPAIKSIWLSKRALRIVRELTGRLASCAASSSADDVDFGGSVWNGLAMYRRYTVCTARSICLAPRLWCQHCPHCPSLPSNFEGLTHGENVNVAYESIAEREHEQNLDPRAGLEAVHGQILQRVQQAKVLLQVS